MKNIALVLFLLIQIHGVAGQSAKIQLLGDFKPGWEKQWIELKIFEKPTKYQVVREDTNLVLMATSDNSMSALWHPIQIYPISFGKITWRWKVEKSLTKNKQERKKIGDDYAARLYVVFEPNIVSWKTRAICYVWAGNEKVGSQFKNPYASSVAMFVIQSGNQNAGKWIREERDFVQDYQQFFGENPTMVSGIALMVDTNNILTEARAWFDDIYLETGNVEHTTDEKLKSIRMQF